MAGQQGGLQVEEVRLVDLEVIKRYSLAVRQESAPAEDLLAALDASRDAVLTLLGRNPPEASTPVPPATTRTRRPRTRRAAE